MVLTARDRAVRLVLTGLVLAALLAGTAWGDDDHFPFGPFRMYSTTNELNGTVNAIGFRAVNADGESLQPRAQDFGMRPAEINGQVSRFRSDPSLLAHLASAYSRLHPDAAPLVEIQLRYGLHQLRDGRPVSYTEQEVATWRR